MHTCWVFKNWNLNFFFFLKKRINFFKLAFYKLKFLTLPWISLDINNIHIWMSKRAKQLNKVVENYHEIVSEF